MLFRDLRPGSKFVFREEVEGASSSAMLWIKTCVLPRFSKKRVEPNAVSTVGTIMNFGDNNEVIEIIVDLNGFRRGGR